MKGKQNVHFYQDVFSAGQRALSSTDALPMCALIPLSFRVHKGIRAHYVVGTGATKGAGHSELAPIHGI